MRSMNYSTPLGQKIGDTFIFILTALVSLPFFYFLTLAALMMVLLLTVQPGSVGDSTLYTVTAVLTLFLLVMALMRYPMPWWHLWIEADAVVLKTVIRRRIPLAEIVFIHAGSLYGLQGPDERKRAVPLTFESRNGSKERIFLVPTEAQACIDHLTGQCPWIGAMTVEGETLLPRDAQSVEATIKRAGRFYLYSGLPMLVLGVVALLTVLARGPGLLTEADNPAMVLYQVGLIPAVLGYGIWSLKKYRGLRNGTSGRGAEKPGP
jgi:hypothetical protein